MKQLIITMLFGTLCYSAVSETTFSNSTTSGREGVYTKNGAIFCGNLSDVPGEETEWQVTGGHTDMKPSWSPEGNRIVFFRAIDTTQHVSLWKTAICVINTDGTGFKMLTSGEYADYNPTWTRDGSLDIVFSRYDDSKKQCVIYRIDPDQTEPDLTVISDPKKNEYALSCTQDGRILITSNRFLLKGIYYLLTPGKNGDKPSYQALHFSTRLKGCMDRCSISPDETRITYEYGNGWKSFNYIGKRIYMADFNIDTLTVSDPVPISPEKPSNVTLYPRFTSDGSQIIYHSNISGNPQLYAYAIDNGETKRVSSNTFSKYEFYCGINSPK